MNAEATAAFDRLARLLDECARPNEPKPASPPVRALPPHGTYPPDDPQWLA